MPCCAACVRRERSAARARRVAHDLAGDGARPHSASRNSLLAVTLEAGDADQLAGMDLDVDRLALRRAAAARAR